MKYSYLFVFFTINISIMRFYLPAIFIFFCISVNAQQERDTTLSQCPVFITDTVSSNNFFIEARPATLKVYRVKGKLTIKVEQRDQFFNLYFHEKRLHNGKYKIRKGTGGKNEVEAAYTFKSGDQSSYAAVSSGTVETLYDKEKKVWQLTVNGLIINQVERSATHYRVRVVLFIK